jgi:hypothetical protein
VFLVVLVDAMPQALGMHGLLYVLSQKDAGHAPCLFTSLELLAIQQLFSHFGSKLAVALRLTADLPDDCVIDTWFAEPVRLLVIPADIFLTNRNAYPVLSRRHQSVVRKFFQLPGMRVLLTGRPHHRLNWEP